MRVATGLVSLGIVIMISVIAYGFAARGGWAEVGKIIALPWGLATMVDIYVGFFLFCGWIWYREGSRVVSAVCTLLVLTLGNLFTCLYVLFAIARAKGDWHAFWLGNAATEAKPQPV